MKFILQSINDVITNSSSEIYQEATQYTVDAVKDIINVILKISGSDKSCDDLFTVSIDYNLMLELYFEDIINKSDINRKYIDIVEEIRNRKDESGYLIDDSKAYDELVKTGLVGDVIPTIKEYVENFDSDWRYANTEVSIIPKGEAELSDIYILSKINYLFHIEAW